MPPPLGVEAARFLFIVLTACTGSTSVTPEDVPTDAKPASVPATAGEPAHEASATPSEMPARDASVPAEPVEDPPSPSPPGATLPAPMPMPTDDPPPILGKAPALYIAGDSTVMTYTGSSIHQAGWGQFVSTYLDSDVAVHNAAIGGRTARRFVEENRLAMIAANLERGDVLLVQFGTNDSNKTAHYDDGEAYFLDAASDFKTWLQRYIDAARTHDATPILVTPPPRNSCKDDGVSFNYSFGAYATAMQELAKTNAIPLVDLGHRTVEFLDQKHDCSWASAHFFLIRADGTVDGTHFQEEGAKLMAGLLTQALAELGPPLGPYVK